MVSCPHCGAQIQDDDYGMTQCGSCHNFVMIDMDGNVVDPGQEEDLQVSQDPQTASRVESIEAYNDKGISNELQSIEVPEDEASGNFSIGEPTNSGSSDVSDVDPGASGIFEYMGGDDQPAQEEQVHQNQDQQGVDGVMDYVDQVNEVSQVVENGSDSVIENLSDINEEEFTGNHQGIELGAVENSEDYQSPLESMEDQVVEEEPEYEQEEIEEIQQDEVLGAADYNEEESEHTTEDPVHQEEIEEDHNSPMDGFFEEENNENQEPMDPNDPLAISEFANSEESQGIDGPYLYRVLVQGIDSKEIRENLREVIEDSKFGWSTDELMGSINSGELLIEGLNPVKAYMLIIRLRTLPLEVSWKQSGIVSVE